MSSTPGSQKASAVDSAEFASLKTEVRALTKGVSEFVIETRARFTQSENELQQFIQRQETNQQQLTQRQETSQQQLAQKFESAIQKISDELQRRGKPNWGVIVAAVGVIGPLIATIAVLYVTPLRSYSEGIKEVLTTRLERDEKTMDVLTSREDRRSDDERQELNELRRRVYGQPATK